jgi:hypothetical protein
MALDARTALPLRRQSLRFSVSLPFSESEEMNLFFIT